ncbi:hypothetical protein OSTOST_25900 [Ostertagia ostertagi]
MPVVMVPIHFDRPPTERPFITSDFMTGIAAPPGRDIREEECFGNGATNCNPRQGDFASHD